MVTLDVNQKLTVDLVGKKTDLVEALKKAI
jgi:hypothetical protein